MTRQPDDNTAPDRSDAHLVAAVLDGDRTAFGQLVDRHLASVFNVAMRLVSNRDEAEDIAQDAFVRAFEKLDQYNADYPFRNWLLKIASNQAINCLRSRKRERLGRESLTLRLAETEQDEPDRPTAGQWMQWLDQLDDRSRTAIVLFHFEEMSYQQIAEILDVPLNTVRTYLHRGRKKLREIIRFDSPEENSQWTVAL